MVGFFVFMVDSVFVVLFSDMVVSVGCRLVNV